MDNYFILTYKNRKGNIEATIDQQCSDTLLGEGLKDICLYLRNLAEDSSGKTDEKESSLTFSWKENEEAGQYDLLPAHDMIHRLEEIKKALTHSEKIYNGIKTSGFLTDDIIGNIDDIILAIQENGKKEAQEKYGDKIKYLFGTIAPEIIPVNELTADIKGMSYHSVLHIMSEIYGQIPGTKKSKFKRRINFDELTFDD